MRKILLIGAGKSSSALIEYLLQKSSSENWKVTVADFSAEAARSKINNHPGGTAVAFDIHNESERAKLIANADLVISMLPANLHLSVAKECVMLRKNLLTASYVSPEMLAMNDDVASSNILFLNECGLDPGIDHMSAMQIIDDVKNSGGKITSFRSYTGGLVAPESNDNPWGYKFSWNPRNVILAGQGTAKLIENGKYRYIPYNRLFLETRKISIDGGGTFDGYANRDSLAYRKLYGLDDIPTMLRGTLRQEGYCSAWNVFVKLGLTDDTYAVEDSASLTYRSLVEAFLPSHIQGNSTEEKLAIFCRLSPESDEIKMVRWTGILDDKKIELENATPALILQKLLEEKWKLKEDDKDMIVMQHQFEYLKNGKHIFHTSSLKVKGDNSVYTGMAKTVGLPLAIAAKLILNGKISLRGIHIPVHREIYEPVLKELNELGVSFVEKQNAIV